MPPQLLIWLFFLGVSFSRSGLASRCACMWCLCCVCVGVFAAPFVLVLVVVLRPCGSMCWRWPCGGLLRVGSPVRFSVLAPFFVRFFPVISQDTLGVNWRGRDLPGVRELLPETSRTALIKLLVPEFPRNSSELSAHQIGRHAYSDIYVIRDIMAPVSFALVPSLSPPAVLRRTQRYECLGFTVFSDSAKAAAPQLEPTLEAALRKYDVHEDIITGCRCNRIKSQVAFIALDRTVEGLTETLKEAFGVDGSKRLCPQARTGSAHRSMGFSLRREHHERYLGRWLKDGWVGAPPYFIAHRDAYHIITAPEHLFFVSHFLSVFLCDTWC